MRLTRKSSWFLAFTAAFAVLAGFVFWGTWSLDFAPVMPDHPITHSADSMTNFLNRWLSSGKLIPGDLFDIIGSPYFWQELKYALSLYFAGLGVAYFCRGKGLPRVACYGAGLLLAFSGYWMTLFSAGHYGWFQWMTYGTFAFGLSDRAVRRGKLRHWLLLGATVSWAGFNQQDLWLLFSVFTAVYFVFRCFCERIFPWKGILVSLSAFVVIGLPNFKDTLQNTLKGRVEQLDRGENVTDKTANAADNRWEFVTNWSMPPEDTAEFVVPGVRGDTSCPFVLSIGAQRGSGVTPYTGRLGRPMNAPRGNYRQHSLYLGVVFCLLALAGVVSAFRKDAVGRREILFFMAAALVFYLLSLGRFFAPGYRIVFALPFGDLIRCPVKWHHLTEFCLAILAGFGLAWLLRALEGVSCVKRFALWLVCGVILVGAVNLACVDRRYCAPVDVREARRTNSSMQMTVLGRDSFSNPQVQTMVKSGRIVSLANYLGNPNAFLVGVLEPYGKTEPKPANPQVLVLGVVSLLAAGAVLVLSSVPRFARKTL